MKFKKLVSTVSALALVMSAFVGLGVTAEAETTTLLEYGTSDVAWTTDNLAEWTAGGNPTLADGVVTISGGNGGYSTSKTIAPTENAIIKVEAVWRGRSNNGRAFSAGNGSYFRFGNIIVAQNDQDKKHGYGFTGLDKIGSVTTFSAGSYRVDVTSSTWLKINMEIDTSSDTLNNFTINSEDGTTEYVKVTNEVLDSPDYTVVAFGYKKSSSVSTTNTEQLKSVKITQTTQEVQKANYTLRYVDESGNSLSSIKADVVAEGPVNSNITVTDSYKTVIDAVGDIGATGSTPKYFYVSDDSEGKTVAEDGSTVVTLTYREASVCTATVNAVVDGNTIKQYASKQFYEGDTETVYYNKYIKHNGVIYEVAANSGYPSYGQRFTGEGSHDVTYTVSDTTYFIEGENLGYSHSFAANGDVKDRYSNGSAARLYQNSKAWTEVLNEDRDSEYKVTVWARNKSNTSESLVVAVKKADGSYGEYIETEAVWSKAEQGEKTVTIAIPAGCRLAIIRDSEYNSNLELDYIAVKDLAPTITYTERTAFATEYGESGTVRFSTTVDSKANMDGATLSGVGYAAVNIKDWDDAVEEMKAFTQESYIDKSYKDTGINLGPQQPFYYEITGIKKGTPGVQFFTVPYLVYTVNNVETTFWGKPITYSGNFEWGEEYKGVVQESTADKVPSYQSIGSTN